MSNYYWLLKLPNPKIFLKSTRIWNVFYEGNIAIKKFTYLSLNFLTVSEKICPWNKSKIHFTLYSPKTVYRGKGGRAPLLLNPTLEKSTSRPAHNNPGKGHSIHCVDPRDCLLSHPAIPVGFYSCPSSRIVTAETGQCRLLTHNRTCVKIYVYYYFIIIYLLTAIGLTPCGSGYIHVHNIN